MKAYIEVKRLMTLRTVILAVTISFTLLCLLGLDGALYMLILRAS